ncbi:MAG: hypothetical protein ACYSU8_07955 [Planctomycetota bacterium]|jgi:hypothetical protein
MMKMQKSNRAGWPRKTVSLIIFLSIAYSAFGLKEAIGENGVNAYVVHQQGITGAGVNIALLTNGNARDGHIAFERENGLFFQKVPRTIPIKSVSHPGLVCTAPVFQTSSFMPAISPKHLTN